MCEDTILNKLSKMKIYDTEEEDKYLTDIVDLINNVGELGYNSITYEIPLEDCVILRICTQISKLFPEISIKVIQKRVFLDWS
jgi:hypothetical protein